MTQLTKLYFVRKYYTYNNINYCQFYNFNNSKIIQLINDLNKKNYRYNKYYTKSLLFKEYRHITYYNKYYKIQKEECKYEDILNYFIKDKILHYTYIDKNIEITQIPNINVYESVDDEEVYEFNIASVYNKLKILINKNIKKKYNQIVLIIKNIKDNDITNIESENNIYYMDDYYISSIINQIHSLTKNERY